MKQHDTEMTGWLMWGGGDAARNRSHHQGVGEEYTRYVSNGGGMRARTSASVRYNTISSRKSKPYTRNTTPDSQTMQLVTNEYNGQRSTSLALPLICLNLGDEKTQYPLPEAKNLARDALCLLQCFLDAKAGTRGKMRPRSPRCL